MEQEEKDKAKAEKDVPNSKSMRTISLSIIVLLSVAILMPGVTVRYCDNGHGATSFVTLDVCHHSDGGTPLGLDIPWIYESCPVVPDAPDQDFRWPTYDGSKPFLLTFACEHPPRA